MKRPWSGLPINDCGEKLVPLKTSFHCLEPHPYLSLGAPYGEYEDPWRLRSGVKKRLILAGNFLQIAHPDLRLAIFDAWRPISVQAFMVQHSINQNCLARGVNRNDLSQKKAFEKIVEEVGKFWATPSLNPLFPPPHSTGAAVDLTLADTSGEVLDMGGDIDHVGPISSPSHYLKNANGDFVCHLFHQRRVCLAQVMQKAGFRQHPHEWWHFSYGDQLWAWKNNVSAALYGSCKPSKSKESTAFSPNCST